MLVLIDESGCAGFKEASSAYFVVAMVIFETAAKAEETSRVIKILQQEQRIFPEFRFSKCSSTVRDAFFKAIADCDYAVYSIYFEKARIYSDFLKAHPRKFYNFAIKQLIEQNQQLLEQAVVKIDGSGDREVRSAFRSYLRQGLLPGKIKDIKLQDSRVDHLVQLADMVVSALARPCNSKSPDRSDLDRWKRMIGKKIKKETWFR